MEVDNNGGFLNVWDTGVLGISPEGVGVDPYNGMIFIAGGFDNMIYEVSGMIGQSLDVDTNTLPEAGGTANFTLNAGPANGGRNYLLFGGVTGTSPGTTLPGGVVLPINWDVFTTLVISLANTPLFTNFMGTLDAQGKATAAFHMPAVTGAVGAKMYFAYPLNNPWDFVSNFVTVEIVP